MSDGTAASNIAPALQTHVVPIDAPITHPQNPRIGDVSAIQESLTRFGQVRPIMIQRSTAHVIAGNHTLKAARANGWTEIAAVDIDMSDEEAVAYMLADNRLAELGRYDNDVLRGLVRQASGNLAGTGWDEDDLMLMMDGMPTVHPTEMTPIDEVTEHHANYREHPEDQIEHITRSLKDNGFYRNVVIANDGTILAGHGLVQAARELNYPKIPVVRLPCGPNDPEALRIVAGDNEMVELALTDARGLTEILRSVVGEGEDADESLLLGTGFDAQTLASLVLSSRTRAEMPTVDTVAEWVGLPEFAPPPTRYRLIISTDSDEDRLKLIEQLGVTIVESFTTQSSGSTKTCWWPPRGTEDQEAGAFEYEGRQALTDKPLRGTSSDDAEGAEEGDDDAEKAQETAVEPEADGSQADNGKQAETQKKADA